MTKSELIAGLAAANPHLRGADVETIRKALCRDGRGNASGPLGVALDILADEAGR